MPLRTENTVTETPGREVPPAGRPQADWRENRQRLERAEQQDSGSESGATDGCVELNGLALMT